jgi:glycosidase
MNAKSLQEINLHEITDRKYHPSPTAWEDQVLYFMMLDRFSDGNEMGFRDNQGRLTTSGATPLFQPGDTENAVQTPADAQRWRDAGVVWNGGTLKGLASKIGYLRRMGITAIWVSPVFKQVSFQQTYHGYGIQNFLEIDPHFGTHQDLRDMVKKAHQNGIYVILDIILNHSGNVFSYTPDRYWTQDTGSGNWYLDPRWDGQLYPTNGYLDRSGQPTIPFDPIDQETIAKSWPDGAIWPAEFQDSSTFTRKGHITNWDYDPEFLEADFYDLKDINLGSGTVDNYTPSNALKTLCHAYKYWIAYADIDGFRVDTVKHMDPGAARYFASVIHEFTQNIGKENFYLIGEITGGRARAFTTLELTGLDAALGIDDIPDKLEYMTKGYRNPVEYFDLFRNSELVQKESHVWFRNKVVTLFDDHDQVRKGQNKGRFCAGDARWKKLLLPVLAVNTTTLGIPCIYYGTEQAFDGQGDSDRYLRECMFGGEFGAFRSRQRHFFDESNSIYQELAKILAVRKQKIALRRGRQYLGEISGDGANFGLPQMIGDEMRSIVPWSRLFDDIEMVVAINTDPDAQRTAWVRVDTNLHQPGEKLICLYATDGQLIGKEYLLTKKGDYLAVWLELPPAGVIILE